MDRQTFEQRMGAVLDRQAEIDQQLPELQEALGEALLAGQDEEAQEIQAHQQELEQELERKQLELEALEGQRDRVERQEAGERLDELQEEYRKKLDRKEEVMGKLDRLWGLEPLAQESLALLGALDDLREEATYLSTLHQLEPPNLEAPSQLENLNLVAFRIKALLDAELRRASMSPLGELHRKTRRIERQRRRQQAALNREQPDDSLASL